MIPTSTPPCDNYIMIGTPPNVQKICSKLVGINTVGDLINKVLTFVFPLAGVLLFLILVWGGFDYLTSAGAPEKVKSAQAKITSALIGFFILVFAFAITKLIGYILGFRAFF